ncbi:hypothetical protein [Paenibacillus medicaginis]|uniref:Uncharacterized protein n=1 Tax=Paenibacillus medicaginis TaxID=1470560 RepID=A0ABV5BUZ6_9BACL
MALIADVFDVILKDSNGDVFGTTTLQDAGIEFTVQENEVRSGKGNQLYGVLHVSRDININLTDVEFKYEWLAKQLGQTVVTGAGTAWSMPKWYTIDAADKISLPETPINDSLAIYDATGRKLALTTDYTVTAKDVTFTGLTAGTEVEVRTYSYTTAPNTQTIAIDNSVFGKGVQAVLETIEINGNEEVVATIQYQFDNAVPSGNFTINTASERNAATQAFNLRVIKPRTTNIVGRFLRIPVTQ